jgi:hypothetical protein
MKINSFILTNHPPAVEKLNNGLDGRPSKLSENMSTAELIKINFSTFYSYIYLIIEVKFKIGDF